MSINRREFLNISAAGVAGLAATDGLGLAWAAQGTTASPLSGASGARLATPESTRRGDMLYRKLGRTGETVSIIGMGGAHIGKSGVSEEESIRLIRKAVDSGVTFMDNSWDYNGGASEERMGKALQGGYRDKVFLMTKFDGRDRKTAAKQIDESLRRLRTDRVDLLQFHEAIRLDDPDRFFAEGGAHEALEEARKAGKTRYVGFTGHKDPAVHLRMLEMARERGFRFDTVQMPLNVMDAHFRSFGSQVLPLLVQEGIGVLGMKSMGDGFILESKAATPVECLHYAMNLPTSVVITGIDKPEILDQALQAAKTFSPLDDRQVADLLSRTRQFAQAGKYELFKTTDHFDSTAKHLEWLGPSA